MEEDLEDEVDEVDDVDDFFGLYDKEASLKAE